MNKNRMTSKEIDENLADWGKKQELAEKVIADIYQVTYAEVKFYGERKDKIEKLEREVKRFFRTKPIKQDFLSQLDHLESIIEDQLKIVSLINETTVFRRISKSNVGPEGYVEALAKQGIEVDIKKCKTDWDIPGYWQFNELTYSNLAFIKEINETKYTNLKELIGDLRTVFKKYGSNVTKIYIQDFLDILIKSYVIDPGLFGGPSVEFLRRDKEDARAYQIDNSNVSFDIIFMERFLARGIPGTDDIINSFKSSIDNYGMVYSGTFENISKLLPLDGLDKLENLASATKSLIRLKDKNRKYILAVEQLLNATTENIRFPLLDAMSDRQEIVLLYDKLRRYNLSPGSYVEFVQKDINQQLLDGRSTLEFLAELSEIPRLGPLAVALINSDVLWYKDPNLERLVEIANTLPNSEAIYKRYLEYSAKSENNKLSILFTLAKYNTSNQELHDTLKLLDKVDNVQLTEIGGIQNIKTIKETLKKPIQEYQPAPSKKQRKSFLSVVKEPFDKDNYERFKMTYEHLEKYNQTSRLWHVWINHPELLGIFIEHISLYQNKNYELLMKDQLLFTEYVKQLQETDFSLRFNELIKREFRNPYKYLYKFLVPEQPYLKTEKEEVITEENAPKIEAERIFVYGGRISAIAREKIQEACSQSVMMYDTYDSERVPQFSERDLVIWLTKFNDHPSYYSIKYHCKKNDIFFLHFNKDGIDPLVEFIKDKVNLA